MGQPQMNPMTQMMQMGTKQKQPINQQQFIQGISNLDKQALAKIVTQARQQGISEQEIENGLNFLLKLR
jgi:hypothetical protein